MNDIMPDISQVGRESRRVGTIHGRAVYAGDYVDELAAIATKYLNRCQELQGTIERQDFRIASLEAELHAKHREVEGWQAERNVAVSDCDEWRAQVQRLRSAYDIEHKQHEALRALWDEEHTRRIELEAEVADWRDTQRSIMAERCGDEQHCTCVPVLRREVKRLFDALCKYGAHAPNCAFWRDSGPDPMCDCGLLEAIEAVSHER